ncbi:MAG TPA: FCD domain-containing protein [Roseiarcus sp.]|jgi:DNA-binding FadR family transcriptional regulator
MARGTRAAIAANLRQRIDAGEWSMTGALPNERDLARAYGVARNTLRKALDELEAEGRLSRQVGRGTQVREPIDRDLAAIMGQILGSSPLDIMNLRMMIEPPATAMAATNSSVAAIESIREAHDQAAAADDVEGFEHWDMEFHKRIFDGTRNEFLANLHEILAIVRNREPMVEIRRRHFNLERKRAYCDQHATIVEALMRRDAEAAANGMREHLLARRSNLFNGQSDS